MAWNFTVKLCTIRPYLLFGPPLSCQQQLLLSYVIQNFLYLIAWLLCNVWSLCMSNVDGPVCSRTDDWLDIN